jgi:hypothetical protein
MVALRSTRGLGSREPHDRQNRDTTSKYERQVPVPLILNIGVAALFVDADQFGNGSGAEPASGELSSYRTS